MKKIKELLEHSCKYRLGYSDARKDVLKLIDKWCSKHKGSTLSKYNIDELKARIEGEECQQARQDVPKEIKMELIFEYCN